MEQQCPICILPLETNSIATLPCNHQLCSKCIEEYIQYSNKCPICVKEFLNYQSPNEEKRRQINENELNNIQETKNKSTQEESFDCITREEVKRQLKDLRYMANEISTKLFSCRSTEEGSEKEREILDTIYEDLGYIDELLDVEEFQGKNIMYNLDEIIVSIKELNSRQYVS